METGNIKKVLLFAGLNVVVCVVIYALMNIGTYLYLMNNQWLMSSNVQYDWWMFLFFGDNASAWLFHANWSQWSIMACVYSAVFGTLLTSMLYLKYK